MNHHRSATARRRAAAQVEGWAVAAVVGYHLIKLAGLLWNAARFPTLTAPAGVRADQAAGVSLLVPARDEADRLPWSLPGLCAQPATEILVLDDRSRDHTATVVRAAGRRDPRVRLVTGAACPPGWIGKNWACHQLADAARGQLLVFCDADVVLRPGALAAAVAERRRQRSEVFSVFPRQHTASFGERLLVPLIDEILLSFLPHDLLRAPVPAAAAANGQFLMFDRAAYRRLGGHRAVRDRIVEDLALARRARRHGLRLGLALGGALVGARMYPGYLASVRGFGKSLREAHGGGTPALLGSAAGHLLAYTVPWLGLGTRHRYARWWWSAAALGPAARLLTCVITGRRGYAEALLPPTLPVAAAPVYALAMRRTARWRGRSYR